MRTGKTEFLFLIKIADGYPAFGGQLQAFKC